ncbi:hypothetical protein [Rhodocaloribacter sp.]
MTIRKQDIPQRADAPDETLREGSEDPVGEKKKAYAPPSFMMQGRLSIHAGSLNLWSGP